MKKNSVLTGSYTESLFWYQQLDLRQIRILRGDQVKEDFDDADDSRLYVTTKKTIKLQDDIASIPIDKLKDYNILEIDLTSMQDATQKCYYPELVREPLKLELKFTFLQNTTLISLYWENECLATKYLFVSLYSSISTLLHCLQIFFLLSPMRLLPFSKRSAAI